jgi:hypothetical protein
VSLPRPRSGRLLLASALAALLPALAAADGGLVRVSQPAGAFVLTVFTTPTPLSVGGADVSVMVQDRRSLVPVLDARVSLELTFPAGGRAPMRVPATRANATNRLLYAATVTFPAAGEWRLRARAEGPGTRGEVACALPVGAGRPRVLASWPWLLLPPVAVALFVLNDHLARRQRLHRRTGSPRTGVRSRDPERGPES